jgi:hypothetical protein
MGRAVFLDGLVTGVKVSVRTGPCEDKVQIIVLSDDSEKKEPWVMASVMREWEAHEALRAAALFVEAEQAFRRRPRITWSKTDRSLGLRVFTRPQDDMVHVRLRSGIENHMAVRELSGTAVDELIAALQQAVEAVRRQTEESYDDED